MDEQREDLGTTTSGVLGSVTTGDHRPERVEPRPKWSKEIALIAGRAIAKLLAEHGHIDQSEIDGMAKAISRHARGPYSDGYSIGKALDDYEGCEPNFAMVEILDGFSVEVTDEINRAEKLWAERVKPQPPFPIGARVRIAADEIGEITDIYQYGAAKYLVKIDGDQASKPPRNARRIVNFEDVQAEVRV